MSHGGARVGSGRKPRKGLVAVSLSSRQDRNTEWLSAIPPEDMPTEQRDFWHRYATRAIEKGTLTVHTEAAFRLLCELDSEKRETKATMDRDGRTFIKVTVDGAGVEHQELKAHPLTGAYGRLAKSVETLMARFGLAPFGKAEGSSRKQPAANPWAEVAK
jgi:phage terminase small subunit